MRYETRPYFRELREECIFDSRQKQILQIGDYFYKAVGDFSLYKTTEKGWQWELDAGDWGLRDIFQYTECGSLLSLVEPVYPFRMSKGDVRKHFLLLSTLLPVEVLFHILGLYLSL